MIYKSTFQNDRIASLSVITLNVIQHTKPLQVKDWANEFSKVMIQLSRRDLFWIQLHKPAEGKSIRRDTVQTVTKKIVKEDRLETKL